MNDENQNKSHMNNSDLQIEEAYNEEQIVELLDKMGVKDDIKFQNENPNFIPRNVNEEYPVASKKVILNVFFKISKL